MLACQAKNQVIRMCGYSAQFLAHGFNTVWSDWDEAERSDVVAQKVDEIAEARLALRHAAQEVVTQAHCGKVVRDWLENRYHALTPLSHNQSVELL